MLIKVGIVKSFKLPYKRNDSLGNYYLHYSVAQEISRQTQCYCLVKSQPKFQPYVD